MKGTSPAKELERFLNYVEACTQEYRMAYDAVNEEDRRLQDLVHEMKFARDKAERNRIATRLADKECPLEVVQEILGHRSPTTTKRYIAQNQAKIRRQAVKYMDAA